MHSARLSAVRPLLLAWVLAFCAATDVGPAAQGASDEAGVNIALAALGGHVVSPADVADKHWRASNLIDGYPIIRGAGAVETSLG